MLRWQRPSLAAASVHPGGIMLGGGSTYGIASIYGVMSILWWQNHSAAGCAVISYGAQLSMLR
jgi:hypothetical protein